MWFEIIVSLLLVLYAVNMVYRGVRLLRNQELVLGVRHKGKVYSRLSPQDKKLFGVGYITSGVVYLIATALSFMGAISNGLYNLSWLLLAGAVLVGPTLMKRRSTYVSPESHPPEMPTLES